MSVTVETKTTKKRKYDHEEKVDQGDESLKTIREENSKIMPSHNLLHLYNTSRYKLVALDFQEAVENGGKLKTIELKLNACIRPLKLIPESKNLSKFKMAVCGTCRKFCSTGRGVLNHYKSDHFSMTEIEKRLIDKNSLESPTLKLIVLG
jgi:hypothetical protein